MRGSTNSVALMSTVAMVILGASISQIGAQFFDPQMDDKVYMDSIQEEVVGEVKETKEELMTQAKIIQDVTRNYIAARIKKNLFKALRLLAEKELQLDAMTMQDRPRQPRQDEDGDEDSEAATTRKTSNVIPQVASLIKAVFGGNINLTSYVESAATFLPKPIGNQLVGVVKLLANNPGYKYTTTTTVATTTIPTTPAPKKFNQSAIARPPPGGAPFRGPGAPGPGAGAAGPNSPPQQQFRPLGTRPPRTTEPAEEVTEPAVEPTEPTDEDEDTNEIAKRAEELKKLNKKEAAALSERQFQIPGIGGGLELLGNLGNRINGILNNNGNGNRNNNNAAPTANNVNKAGNKTTTGFDEEPMTGIIDGNKMSGIDVGSLAKEVRNGLGDLIKVMPDIFRGAHEAYKLLSTVSQLFSRLDSEP